MFEIRLADNVRIVVVFYREKKRITDFVAVLEVKGEMLSLTTDEWTQVLRFDTAHGYPHMDKLDKHGNKKSTIKFDYLSNEEALSMAIDILKGNYEVSLRGIKMIKKQSTAADIEVKLRRMGARKVADEEFKTAQEYSNIYRFVVESFENKSNVSRSRRIARSGVIMRKKERV